MDNQSDTATQNNNLPEAWKNKSPRQLAAMGVHPGVLGPKVLGPDDNFDPTNGDDPLIGYTYHDPQIGAYVIPEPGVDLGKRTGRSMSAHWESPYVETLGVTPYGTYYDEAGKKWRYGTSGANAKNEELGVSTRFDSETNSVDPEHGYVQPGNVYYTPPQEVFENSAYQNSVTSRGLTFAPDSHYSPSRTGLTNTQMLDYSLNPDQRRAAFEKAAQDYGDGFADLSGDIQSNRAASAARELYVDNPTINQSLRRSANRKLQANGGDKSTLTDLQRRALETAPSPGKYPIDWAKIRQDMPNASRAYGYPDYEEWLESTPALNVNPENQTSFQTGSVPGDANFTSEQEVLERIAAIRFGRGLPADTEDDKRWTEKITRGEASIGDARTALTDQALGYGHIDSQEPANFGFVEPVYPEPNPNPPAETPSGHEIRQGGRPTIIDSDGSQHRISGLSEEQRQKFGLPVNSDEWYDYTHRNFPDAAEGMPLPGTRGAYTHGWGWDESYNGPEGPIPQDRSWRQINIHHPDYSGTHPKGVTVGLANSNGLPATYNPSQRTSSQTGSVPGDANYTTEEEIQGRIAAIRRGRGLSPDEAGDRQWTERVLAGQASIGDARTSLTRRADSLASSAQGYQARSEPSYNPAAQASLQTGSTAGDANFTTKEEIQGRIAEIRRARGLEPDEASDRQWAERVLAGQASIGDARTILTHTAQSLASGTDNGTLDNEAGLDGAVATSSSNIHNSDNQTSFQAGSVAGDARYQTEDEIRRRVAQIRQNRGLSADHQADVEWANKIVSNQATIGDARTALTRESEKHIQSGSSLNTPDTQPISTVSQEERTRRQVAQIRDDAGLSSDPASDQIWVDRITSGSADIDEARRRIEERASQLSQAGGSSTSPPTANAPLATSTGSHAAASDATGQTRETTVGQLLDPEGKGPNDFDESEVIKISSEDPKWKHLYRWSPKWGTYIAPERHYAASSHSSTMDLYRSWAAENGVTVYSGGNPNATSGSPVIHQTADTLYYADGTQAPRTDEHRTAGQSYEQLMNTKVTVPSSEIGRSLSRVPGQTSSEPTDHPYATTKRGLTLAPDSHYSPGRTTMTVQQVLDRELSYEQRKAAFDEAAKRFTGFLDMSPSAQRAQALGVAREMYPDVKVAGIPYDYETDSRTAFADNTESTSGSSTYNPDAHTSNQTGSVGRDSEFTSPEQIRDRIAQIRENRGLAADPESDQIWVDRVIAGTHTIGDARTAITEKAQTKAAAPTSDETEAMASGSTSQSSTTPSISEDERIRRQVAQIRDDAGLSADPASDQIWVDRITSGSADIDEARRRITQKASETTSASSTTTSSPTTTTRATTQVSEAERIRQQVASYRRSLGLPPSGESDQIWVDRITSGSADMSEAKSRLEGAAKNQGLISMNAANIQSPGTSNSGIQTLPGAMPTKSSSRSTNILPDNLA